MSSGNSTTSRELWRLFNNVEAEAVINALRRWQSSFGNFSRRQSARTTVNDPYVRLILDRCLPPEVEAQLCSQPLDRLMQEVIAVRTTVIDETLLQWCKDDNITQVVIIDSGFDTRAWRLKWPPGVRVYEIDSAMIQAQKLLALGDVQETCKRLGLVGDTFNLPAVFRSLRQLGFDATQPAAFLVEDVIEYTMPELASELFASIYAACARGSRMVVTLSDLKLRNLLKRFNHAMHLVEEYEPPGIVLFRIDAAGWRSHMTLSGELETRFGVDLHGCLYVVRAFKP